MFLNYVLEFTSDELKNLKFNTPKSYFIYFNTPLKNSQFILIFPLRPRTIDPKKKKTLIACAKCV